MTNHAAETRPGRRLPMWFIIMVAVGAGLVGGLSALSSPSVPDENVRVTNFTPSGRADRAGNITVEFSNDLVPNDSLDRLILKPPLKFDPPLAGLARWIATDALRFYPDERLAPATEYRVKVQSDHTFIHGNRINEKRTFRFTTPGLQIEQASYRTEPVADAPSQVRINLTLEFNYAVDLEQLTGKLAITGESNAEQRRLSFQVLQLAPPVYVLSEEARREEEGARAGYDATCDIITEPITLTGDTQWYRLRLKPGLECDHCGAPLRDEFYYTILVSPKGRLVIHRLSPRSTGTGFNVDVHISASVDPDELRDYVSVEPEIDFTLGSSHGRLRLQGDFRPGRTYTVTLAQGMPGRDGAVLEHEFSSPIAIPDLPPSVAFTARGSFLSRKGSGNVELRTINVDELAVEVEQIFENNLLHFLTGSFDRRSYYRSSLDLVGRRIFLKDKPLAYKQNQPLLTTLDVAGIVGDSARGVFVVTAYDKERRPVADSRRAMLTDIGISARMADNFLMVWAHSLADTRPLGRAQVRLISKNNQILAEGRTDTRGIVTFDNLADRTEGFEPYVITVTHEDDLSYLRFQDCLLPTEDFDVGGRPYLLTGYEAFVYCDRGIYRPGDTAHIVAMVRGVDAAVPPEFPFALNIRDPKGKLFHTLTLTAGNALLTAADFALPVFAPTGGYTITAEIGDDYRIGRTDFLVEEFMPDRIKVTIATPQESYRAGDELVLDVTGTFLFGPPARGHRVGGQITFEHDLFRPTGWGEYTFTTPSRTYARTDVPLPDSILDGDGRHTYRHQLSDAIQAPSALKALLSATVSEQGGRAVGAYKELRIHPYDRYLGLHSRLDGYAKTGETVSTDVIAIAADGQPVDLARVQVRFNRIVYHSIFKRDQNGRYRYVSERSTQIIDSTTIRVPTQGAAVDFTPSEYGQYEIEVADGADGHVAAVRFYASGWGYAPWSMANPDRIELDLDQPEYQPGETAVVQVRTPFPGRLLLTVERDRVLDMITVEMEENTAEIELPVKIDYFPNVYVAATLIRSAADVGPDAPARAFGIVPLTVSSAERSLPIAITAPPVITPRQTITIDLSVGKPGVTELTVAAVDAGILQLTDFTTPDPLEFFCGKKRIHLKPYDMYSFVYPEVEPGQSHFTAAGGRMFAEARKRHLVPILARRVKPVALWSGVVRTDVLGQASVAFDIPQFNGKLVLMAVATQGNRFGSAAHEITVRDRIVMQESFPRFVAPNDLVEGFVSVFNNLGRTADIDVSLDLDGPASLLSDSVVTLRLPADGEGSATFSVHADLVPGVITCRLSATGGADTARTSFELPNRPAQPLKTISGSGIVTTQVTGTFTLPGGWVDGTDRYVIRTSSLAAVRFARDIQYLLRYPYGCLEQTTSRLFPLLYFNDLVKFVQPELFGGGGPNYFIQEGIARLRGMQFTDGSFAFWRGGSRRHHWSSVYASHFLVEARNAGYHVEDNYYNRMLSNVENIARGRNRDVSDKEHRIYAAFVLAKAGQLTNTVVNYLKDIYADDLPAAARFQMAGALAMAGETDYATTLIPADVQADLFEPETGGTFRSGVRSTAILLDVMLAIAPDHHSVPVLAQSLMESLGERRWYTTQSTSFALMALGAFFKDRATPDFVGTLRIAGDSTYVIDTASFMLTRQDCGDREVTISIDGAGPCFYYWQASGVAVDHTAEEFDRGIKVRRTYLNENGEALDTDSVRLGHRVIGVITAEAENKPLDHVVINDLIPAGFEIENPRIKTSPALSWIPKKAQPIDHQDIRDDRLLIFAGLRPGRPLRYFYSLRAVSAGEFVVPPVAAECMYNPVIAGAASSGRMVIKGAEEH